MQELLENLERQARHPDSPLRQSATASGAPEGLTGTSAGDKTPRTMDSGSMAVPEHHTTSSSGARASSLSRAPERLWLVPGVTFHIAVYMLAPGAILQHIMPDGCKHPVEAS